MLFIRRAETDRKRSEVLPDIPFVGSVVAFGRGQPKVRFVRNDRREVVEFEVYDLSTSLLKALRDSAPDSASFSQLFFIEVFSELTSANGVSGEGGRIPGTYRIFGTSLRFTPQHSLLRGTRYRMYVKAAHTNCRTETQTDDFDWLVTEFLVAGAHQLTTSFRHAEVEYARLYTESQTSDSFRIEIQFSVPMAQGAALRYLELYDSSGNRIDRTFLELLHESWDAHSRRLSIRLQPPHQPGSGRFADQDTRRYRLVVRSGWPTAGSRCTLSDYEYNLCIPSTETAIGR